MLYSCEAYGENDKMPRLFLKFIMTSSSIVIENRIYFFARSSPFLSPISPALCKTEKNTNMRVYGGRQLQVGGNGEKGKKREKK
jgi:hypothetical protein